MSSELCNNLSHENRIDKAIYEAEKEFAETEEYVDADAAFAELEGKYFG